MACLTEVMCVAYTLEKAREFSSFDLECVGRSEVFPEGLKYLRKAGMYPEQAEEAVKASMTRESMKVVIDPWME